MSTRQQIFQAVYNRSLTLNQNGQTESFDQLRQWLNANGFRRPGLNTPYSSGRGIAKVVSCTYAYVDKELKLNPQPVADVFVNQNGDYAY